MAYVVKDEQELQFWFDKISQISTYLNVESPEIISFSSKKSQRESFWNDIQSLLKSMRRNIEEQTTEIRNGRRELDSLSEYLKNSRKIHFNKS